MNNRISPKLTSFVVASTLLLLIAGVPAEAGWQDNSGDLDFGGDDSTSNTLMVAGGAIAIGVGVWALVRHSKKKRMARLERQISERRAALIPASKIDALVPAESSDELSFEEVVQRMIDMRATAAR